MTVVYFIRAIGQDGPVKIGCSALIRERLASLNAWSPQLLEIAATIPGGYDLERRFHGMFCDCRDHGEWFAWTPELGKVIEQIRAGTFDTATLPEPLWLQSLDARRPRAVARREPGFRDDTLLADVLAFCAEQQLAPSMFGRAATNDPGLVGQLKQGRNARAAVSRRIRAFMASYRPDSTAHVQ